MKKQPTPPTPAELSEQAKELNAVFPRQLCELTIDEAETAFHRATEKNGTILGIRTEYCPISEMLEIRFFPPKMCLMLYDNGAVQCFHSVGTIDCPVLINAPALTDYLRSVGIDYPAQ